MRARAEILGDWGTSNLRLWLRVDGIVKETAKVGGLGALTAGAAKQLADVTAAWREAHNIREIVLCGMAGARGGLFEAGYVDCPADSAKWRTEAAHSTFAGLPLTIGSGLACLEEATDRHDVMRGEETQAFGALKLHSRLSFGSATFLLPGTHSKWLTITDGRVTNIRTFLTGELHALLRSSSLLAALPAGTNVEVSEDGFAAGMLQASQAEGFMGSLFQARAAQLREGRSAAWAYSYLSGLLLTSEVAEMHKAGGLPRTLVLIGSRLLCERYAHVLASFGSAAEILDDELCTLAGLELILDYD